MVSVMEDVDRKVSEEDKDDLNTCSDGSDPTSGNVVQGSRPFGCLRLLSKHEIGMLERDGGNVVRSTSRPSEEPRWLRVLSR